MCRHVGIIVYQGLIEEVMAFENETAATEWIAGRRLEYGIEKTLDSVVWDVRLQLPVRVSDDEVHACNQQGH
jgi:hypothetical protein